VIRVNLKPGDAVKVGDTVMVVESMKMETPVNAHVAGVIGAIHVNSGDKIKAGHVLFVVKH
jgi:biotin carboxyl carrier protein